MSLKLAPDWVVNHFVFLAVVFEAARAAAAVGWNVPLVSDPMQVLADVPERTARNYLGHHKFVLFVWLPVGTQKPLKLIPVLRGRLLS